MKIELIDIKDLKLDKKNARKHPQKNLDQIKYSLENYGQQKPIVIDAGNTVRAGNGTLMAAKDLGWEKIACVRSELTGSNLAAYALVDNRSTETSEWDMVQLPETLKILFEDGINLEALGFSQSDLAEAIEEGKTDPDAIPENVETRCKPGDLWLLGEHRLLCGDSTNVQHVERLMNGEKADMVFTDPPYGISYDDTKHKNYGTYKASSFGMIQGDDKPFSFQDFLWLEQKEQIWFGSNYYCQQLPEGGSWYVWDKKTEAQQENGMLFTNDFELAWSKTKHKQEICRKIWCGAINKEKGEDRLHPTQKPISLIEWFFERIKANSVIDLFLGSGSTLIACEKTGRKCYGMEIDPHYCDVILKRWEDFTGKTATYFELT